MKTVYKYPLKIVDYQVIEIPEDARILHIAMQHDELYLWALIDKSKPMVHKTIRVAGTGHPIDHYVLDYLGTFMMTMINGDLVFHVFEIK